MVEGVLLHKWFTSQELIESQIHSLLQKEQITEP